MSEHAPASKSAKTVLRSIVSPAVGVTVAALVIAGATSACGSGQSAAGPDIEPVGAPPSTVERVGVVPRDPGPDVSAAPSASAIPWVGEKARDPEPDPSDKPSIKVGMMPEEPRPVVSAGVAPAPGFSGSRAVHARSTARPTRATRRVTDADASLARSGRRRALV